jgi:WhiB family transcriptional regulator, redox-sensing transcriptional regulator
MRLSFHRQSEFPESRAGLSCRDIEADLFFPVGTIGPAQRQIDEAKPICRACPARAACLAWAMDGVITA